MGHHLLALVQQLEPHEQQNDPWDDLTPKSPGAGGSASKTNVDTGNEDESHQVRALLYNSSVYYEIQRWLRMKNFTRKCSLRCSLTAIFVLCMFLFSPPSILEALNDRLKLCSASWQPAQSTPLWVVVSRQILLFCTIACILFLSKVVAKLMHNFSWCHSVFSVTWPW